MPEELEQLKRLSAKVGQDLTLTQGAGGNTSIKVGPQLFVKASGKWLANACEEPMFLPVDLERVRRAIPVGCEDPMAAAPLSDTDLRASIETSFHALLPQRVVVHVHSVNTIAWAIREDAETQLSRRLKEFNWSFIPYARPGLQLSRAISKNLKPSSNVIVLQNHGLAVAGESVVEAESLLLRVVEKLQCQLREVVQPDLNALQIICANTDYAPALHPVSHVPALDPQALKLGCANVYYPDHVVFLGTIIPTDMNTAASAIAVPGKGVLIRKDAKPSIDPMLRCLGDVFLRTSADASLKALTATEIDQLLNWDAEKYRQTLQQP